MNDEDIPQKTPSKDIDSNGGEQHYGNGRVFDISEDSISPLNDEELLSSISTTIKNKPVPPNTPEENAKNIQTPEQLVQDSPFGNPSIASPTKQQIQSQAKEDKPYSPSGNDLLDKNIGTFDATPFAPAKNAPPPIPPILAPLVKPDAYPKNSIPAFNSNLSRNGQVSSTYNPQTTLIQKKPTPITLKDIPANIYSTKNTGLQDEIASILPKNNRKINNQQLNNPYTPSPLHPIGSSPTDDPTPDDKPLGEIPKPLRTYEGDVAEVMSHRRTSTASIAIAESKKQDGEERMGNIETSHAGRKIFLVILSIFFVGAGLAGAYYLYSISPLAPVVQTAQQQKPAQSLVPSDTQSVITIANTMDPLNVQATIGVEVLKVQKPNSIKEVIIATKNETGSLSRISSQDIINDLDISVPDILQRSLANYWMMGIYNNANNEKSLFVVVTSNFFQNTFAGMLQWENTMADELKQYLYQTEPAGISNSGTQRNTGTSLKINSLDNLNNILPSTASSSTASSSNNQANKMAGMAISTTTNISTSSKITSISSTTLDITQPLRPYQTIRGKFEDRIIKNKDVREFRTETGTVLFLYSFIDNNHLIVTPNEATLVEVLNRLEKQSFIR